MSHFNLSVITKDWASRDDLEKILYPYSESYKVKPYISMTKKEVIDEKEKIVKEDWAKKYANCSYEEFVKKYYGEDSELDSKGNLLSTSNPNAKWDWFEIGGRWKGMLLLKKEHHGKNSRVNTACIKSIDWEKLNKLSEADEAYWSRFWDIAIEGKEKTALEKEKHKFIVLYKKEYYLENYRNKEKFLERAGKFATHAVITPDRKWHEIGKMGFWGICVPGAEKGEEWELGFYDRFIKPYLDSDFKITIADCHI